MGKIKNFEQELEQQLQLHGQRGQQADGKRQLRAGRTLIRGNPPALKGGVRNGIEICFCSYEHIELINIFRTIKI